MKYLLSLLPLSLLVSFSAVAAPQPATLKELNGIVAGLRCSGALVTLGRADSERAIILAAGHCTAPSTFYPPGSAEGGSLYPVGDEAVATYLPSNDPVVMNSRPPSLTNYPIYSVLYGTMTTADVSLFEIDKTIGELKALGYRFFEIADRLPKVGEKLTVTSGLWGQIQQCEVAEIFADNADEKRVFGTSANPYQFRNMILLSKDCTAKPGWSGSPLFDNETGLIYGVLSRLQTRITPSSLNPLVLGSSYMRSRFMTDPTEPEAEIIASNVLDLKDCLSNDGKLSMNAPGCVLPKPVPRPAPVPPAPKPAPQPPKKKSSTWPR